MIGTDKKSVSTESNNLPQQASLFEGWMAIERGTGRSMTDILADINAAAGTHYKHNWPSMVASRGYELERCPLLVRRYMMQKVLAEELSRLGLDLTDSGITKLVVALT
jgi:hypothetical protein